MGSLLNRLAEAILMCTHNQCFEQKILTISNIFERNFQFLQLEKSLLIAWAYIGKVLTDFCNAQEEKGGERDTRQRVDFDKYFLCVWGS